MSEFGGKRKVLNGYKIKVSESEKIEAKGAKHNMLMPYPLSELLDRMSGKTIKRTK